VAHINLAEDLLRRGQPRQSLEEYKASYRAKPNPLALYAIGDAFGLRGDSKKSLYYACQGFREDPNRFRAHAHLGDVQDRLGNAQAASYHYREALKLKPEDIGVLCPVRLDSGHGSGPATAGRGGSGGSGATRL